MYLDQINTCSINKNVTFTLVIVHHPAQKVLESAHKIPQFQLEGDEKYEFTEIQCREDGLDHRSWMSEKE